MFVKNDAYEDCGFSTGLLLFLMSMMPVGT